MTTMVMMMMMMTTMAKNNNNNNNNENNNMLAASKYRYRSFYERGRGSTVAQCIIAIKKCTDWWCCARLFCAE